MGVVALACGIHEALRDIDPCPACAKAMAEIEEDFRLHWVYDQRGGSQNRGCWRPRKRSEYPMPAPPVIDETPREDPDDLPHQAARRVQAGESYWQVARHMGVESETIQLWCRRAGVVEVAGASERHMREHRQAVNRAREERKRGPVAPTPEPVVEELEVDPPAAQCAPPVRSKRGGRKSTVVRGVRLCGEELARARAEAVAFVASGKSYYRAATKFGVSHTTLRVWCAQAGVVSTSKQGRSEGYMAVLAAKQAERAIEPPPSPPPPPPPPELVVEEPEPEPEPVVEEPEVDEPPADETEPPYVEVARAIAEEPEKPRRTTKPRFSNIEKLAILTRWTMGEKPARLAREFSTSIKNLYNWRAEYRGGGLRDEVAEPDAADEEDDEPIAVPAPANVCRSVRPRHDDAKRDHGVQLIRSGMALKEAAREVGVATSTLLHWCEKADVRSQYASQHTEETRVAAVELYEQGRSLKEIARRIGASRSAIRTWILRARADAATKPKETPMPEKITKLTMADGATVPLDEPKDAPVLSSEIVRMLGLPTALEQAVLAIVDSVGQPDGAASRSLDDAISDIERHRSRVILPRIKLGL